MQYPVYHKLSHFRMPLVAVASRGIGRYMTMTPTPKSNTNAVAMLQTQKTDMMPDYFDDLFVIFDLFRIRTDFATAAVGLRRSPDLRNLSV